MNSFFMCFALCVVSTVGFSARAAVSKKLDNPVAFATSDEAAVAALRIAASQSDTYEYGGCLYVSEGQYFYTTPVSDRNEYQFKAECQLDIKSFVGIFHTHPDGGGIGFSGEDVKVANGYKVVSYIAILQARNSRVVKFIPEKTKSYCGSRIDDSDLGEVCSDGDPVSVLN